MLFLCPPHSYLTLCTTNCSEMSTLTYSSGVNVFPMKGELLLQNRLQLIFQRFTICNTQSTTGMVITNQTKTIGRRRWSTHCQCNIYNYNSVTPVSINEVCMNQEKIWCTPHNELLPMGYFVLVVMCMFSDETHLNYQKSSYTCILGIFCHDPHDNLYKNL